MNDRAIAPEASPDDLTAPTLSPGGDGAEVKLSPREFLRARRPERFSDTVQDEAPALDRSLLEFQLDTLTSRGQETDFERFARAVAAHAICPNLLSQTGPTGGGDSKVDSETYPVAPALALTWYMGDPAAAGERWAFAFSAKKDWPAKVRSDIAKIAATNRGYTKAFFISNQAVPDRRRAQVEDQLRKAHKLDVRILDRTWLLDRVFTDHLEQLAVETLRLTTGVQRTARLGPQDTAREQELTACDARIDAAVRDGHLGFVLVDDCLEAAMLARSLERPRAEVEGRFLRAQRVAADHGTPHQQLTAAYQHTWATYWWHEDFSAYTAQYADVERRAVGTRNPYELELLTNLWFGLHSAVAHGGLTKATADIDARRRTLERELQRLASDGERRTAALHARTLLLQVRLGNAAPADVSAALRKLSDVIDAAEGLVGFPLQPLVEILTEIGDHFGGESAYDAVFERMTAATARRDGERARARLLLKRGVQQLEVGRPYDAIRTFGRALGGLAAHESRQELVLALCACAQAYERVGLLWAARGTLLSAASFATNDFWTYEDVTPRQAIAYNRLKWVELQLGRLPHVLAWDEVDRTVRAVLKQQGHDPEQLMHGEPEFDFILGLLLLRADVWQLKRLIALPDALDRAGLWVAATALRYALGHEEGIPTNFEGILLNRRNETAADDPAAHHATLLTLFRRWRDQPAADDLPAMPALGDGVTATLESSVLGCHVVVDVTQRPPCVELGESFLAALEALLATGAAMDIVAREPDVRVNIRPSDVTEAPFTFERHEVDGRPVWEVRCRTFDPFHLDVPARETLRRRLWTLLADVIGHTFHFANVRESFDKLFDEERVGHRALDVTGSFVTLGNVLGDKPKTTLPVWLPADAKQYPLRREDVWDAEDRRALITARGALRAAPAPDEPPEPPELPSDAFGSVKHTEMRTVSLIREPLWNAAKWSGAGYWTFGGDHTPPVLALLFQNQEAAAKIFEGWRSELGERDEQDLLRVAIIRGISRAHPHHYRIVLSADLERVLRKPGAKQILSLARVHKMEPTTDENLRRFLVSYNRVRAYALAPALTDAHGTRCVLAPTEYRLHKRNLMVKEAWQIGRHDPDLVGVAPDDDPIVPADVAAADVPWYGLRAWRQSRPTGRSQFGDAA